MHVASPNGFCRLINFTCETIDDGCSNQDELELTVLCLLNTIDCGFAISLLGSKKMKVSEFNGVKHLPQSNRCTYPAKLLLKAAPSKDSPW